MSTDNVEYVSADTEPDLGDAYAGSYETTEGRVYTVAGRRLGHRHGRGRGRA